VAGSLIRAALTLLCAGAVIFGTGLFPAALDADLDAGDPIVSTPDATASDPGTPTRTATPTDSPTETATPTPTETTAPPPDDADQRGGNPFSFIPELVGLVMLGGLGYIGFLLVRGLLDVDGSGGGWSFDGFGWLPSVSLPFAGAVARVPRLTTLVLLSGASALATVGTTLNEIASGVARGVAAGLGPLSRMATRSVSALPGAVGVLIAGPFRALGALGGSGGLLGSLSGGLASPSTLEPDDPTDEDARAAADIDDGSARTPPPASVREAWARLTAAVPVSNPEATTPGEYARRAIDIGLPAEPVRRLTALFRRVEYGGEPGRGHLDTARRAWDRIRGGDSG